MSKTTASATVRTNLRWMLRCIALNTSASRLQVVRGTDDALDASAFIQCDGAMELTVYSAALTRAVASRESWRVFLQIQGEMPP